jgi:hypothetical protein
MTLSIKCVSSKALSKLLLFPCQVAQDQSIYKALHIAGVTTARFASRMVLSHVTDAVCEGRLGKKIYILFYYSCLYKLSKVFVSQNRAVL